HRVDHRERLLLRPGADREHRDHRAHAEDDPEHGQKRPQLVRAQAVPGAAEGLAGIHQGPSPPAAAAGWALSLSPPSPGFAEKMSEALFEGSRRAIRSPGSSPFS